MMKCQRIDSTDILGVQISAVNMPSAVRTIEGWIANNDRSYVCICTVNSIMEANRDPRYMKILNEADLRTPDGMPLVWFSRKVGRTVVARVCGPDLMPLLASRSAVMGHRHYFYGGAPGVVEELTENLAHRFPGLNIAGKHTPPMLPVGATESDETIRTINESGADIVWVGLGTPKQDFWIANHRGRLNAPVLIAVGAAFDFHSGRLNRAPEWIQACGLEWAFRISQDPQRLLKRYARDNVMFVLLLLVDLVKRKKPSIAID